MSYVSSSTGPPCDWSLLPLMLGPYLCKRIRLSAGGSRANRSSRCVPVYLSKQMLGERQPQCNNCAAGRSVIQKLWMWSQLGAGVILMRTGTLANPACRYAAFKLHMYTAVRDSTAILLHPAQVAKQQAMGAVKNLHKNLSAPKPSIVNSSLSTASRKRISQKVRKYRAWEVTCLFFTSTCRRGSSDLQIAQQELQPKMQQWHNSTGQASHQSSHLSDSSATDGSQQPGEPGLEVDSPEYDELVRDVAARIIQTYWRRCQARLLTMHIVRSSDGVLIPRMDPSSRPRQNNSTRCHTPESSTKSGMILLSHHH